MSNMALQETSSRDRSRQTPDWTPRCIQQDPEPREDDRHDFGARGYDGGLGTS